MSKSSASVDTNLFPHATGAAESLVEAHSAENELKLYAGWFCPFVQRAWLVLEEKNIPYQYIEINPYHKAKEFLELNPRGLVPTLGVPVLKGKEGEKGKELKPLYESNVICEYLDEVYSDEGEYGRGLFPADAYERARCRIWIDHISSRIVPSFYRFCQHQPHSAYSIEEARKEFLGHLKTFIQEADKEGPFFQGEDEEVWERWRRWAEAVEGRKSVVETQSSREQYIPAYQRYAEDTTQSEVSKATRGGRNLP